MQIKALKVGALGTNCYIISNRDSCIVIDPGENADAIIREIGGSKVEQIILTHLHFDHIMAAKELKSRTGAKIYCHKNDIGVLGDDILREKDIGGFLKDNQEIYLKAESYKLKAIFTPGHTPGSICLYFPEQNVLFSGDTIFKGNIGATHFKSGKFTDLKYSIEKKLLVLPSGTIVYPGHGENFRLGDYKEKIKNILK